MIGIIILYAVIAVILHAYTIYPYHHGYINQYNINGYRAALILIWGSLLFNILTTAWLGWNWTPQTAIEWICDIITGLLFVAGNTLLTDIKKGI